MKNRLININNQRQKFSNFEEPWTLKSYYKGPRYNTKTRFLLKIRARISYLTLVTGSLKSLIDLSDVCELKVLQENSGENQNCPTGQTSAENLNFPTERTFLDKLSY